MTRSGTYDTIDAPTEKVGQALNWLRAEFAKIDGRVRLVSNPHDFGDYPSYEVDLPASLAYSLERVESADDHMDDCNGRPCRTCDIHDQYEEWTKQANEIETAYSEKFAEVL